MPQKRVRTQAALCLIVAMALWGSSFVALKIAFAALTPMWVICARMTLGSLFFLAAWRWRGRFQYRAGDWKYLMCLAVCEPCVYFIFEALAIQNTSASQAGMITALLPLLVAAGASFFLGEKIGRLRWLGFLVAMAGSVWLSVSGTADAHAPNPLKGNFYEFLAMVCAMGYTLLLKYLSERYSAFFLTAMQAFIGAPFFLLLALTTESIPTSISPLGIAAVVYLGIVVTVLAYGLYNFGVSHLEANQASAYTNLIPFFSLLTGVLVLGETLNSVQIAAVGLIFFGVALSQWRRPAPLAAGILD